MSKKKEKIRKWKIEVELIDMGEPYFSNIAHAKVTEYFLDKGDIEYKLRYCFSKMTGIAQFRNLEIRRIK